MSGALSPAVLRRLHRGSALVLGLFLVLHLGNHLAGLAGQEVHRAVQQWVRPFYRGWAEPILLAACAVQVATGLRLAWARRRARGRGRLQPLSGAVLALFLLIHVSAVLTARSQGTETDLAFAAAGMHAGAWWLFFAPYYGAAVLALGLHLSVPLARRSRAAGHAAIGISALVALLILLLLSGAVTPLVIPAPLLEAFGA